jgi:aminoglycoside phosphotransferase family enzyme/predicted kinase
MDRDMGARAATADDNEDFVQRLRQDLLGRIGAPVALLQTHASWILLTPRLAFKLKKPVRLPFLDFSTPALRWLACAEEVRLNRRLAGSMYRGLVAVRGSRARPTVGGEGPVIDTLVCMRRFPADAVLSERLADGRLAPAHVERLARRIADFHDAAEIVGGDATQGAVGRAFAPVAAVLSQLERVRPAQALQPVGQWLLDRARVLAGALRERQAAGAIRDCHGDLHLSNTVVLGDDVTAFDCLEFDASLRRIDVMSDVAFLTMDLKAHDRPDLAHRFLEGYLERRGDYDGLRVLRFYEVHRALVRDLVASLRAPASAAAVDYLATAGRLVREATQAPRLGIVSGLSGSGKSTLAIRLAQRSGALRVRSDVERKRLFGLSILERSDHVEGGIYGGDASARTYARLADCASRALSGGYSVIVDAAFLSAAQRHAFRALATQRGASFTVFAVHADPSLLRARVRERLAAGHDPSEADETVLEMQMRTRQDFEAWERPHVIRVDAGRAVDVEPLAAHWIARSAEDSRGRP